MEVNVRGIIARTTREFHPDLCTMGKGTFSRSIVTGVALTYTSAPLLALIACSSVVRVTFRLQCNSRVQYLSRGYGCRGMAVNIHPHLVPK
jgi:hypothetical protein